MFFWRCISIRRFGLVEFSGGFKGRVVFDILG